MVAAAMRTLRRDCYDLQRASLQLLIEQVLRMSATLAEAGMEDLRTMEMLDREYEVLQRRAVRQIQAPPDRRRSRDAGCATASTSATAGAGAADAVGEAGAAAWAGRRMRGEVSGTGNGEAVGGDSEELCVAVGHCAGAHRVPHVCEDTGVDRSRCGGSGRGGGAGGVVVGGGGTWVEARGKSGRRG